MRRQFIKAGIAAAIGGPVWTAFAQDNSSPIRVLVGFAPGGALDAVARAVAESLRDSLKQTVIVDNKPGANQQIAIAELKRSRADGLTLVLANNAPFTMFPHLYKKLAFDPVKDFTPIGRITNYELCISAGPMAPPGGIQEFLAWAKKNPKDANYATSGPGNISHLVGEMVSRASKVPLNPVPYKGGAPALIDVAGGQIPISVDSILEPLEMYKAGKVRMLATTGAQRNFALPNVPTLRESGIDVVADAYVGLYGPANLPAERLQRLSNALSDAMKSPELQRRIKQAAMTPAFSTSAELASVQVAALGKWRDPIKATGLELD